ncbi:MAG TPA: hypothetical protein VGH15_06810 [Caulobacteraceae bacterium]|jgi:hypothetical protein
MDLMATAISGASALVVALTASEISVSGARWADRLLRHALKLTPAGERERRQEEWAAHLNDIPGPMGKIHCALGFVKAAYVTLFGPALPALARLLFIAAKNPKATWRIYLALRNWRIVAAKGREFGWNIPKCVFDLTWAEFREYAEHQDDPRWHEYDTAAFAQRVANLSSTDRVLMAFLGVCAARIKPTKVFPNIPAHWDEIALKIDAKCFPGPRRTSRAASTSPRGPERRG